MAKKMMVIALILFLVSYWHMEIAESSARSIGRVQSDNKMKKIITLKSSDGESFEVDKTVALQSQTIKNMIEEASDDGVDFPLPNVTSKILAKVIVYCKKHVDNTTVDLRKWDTEFMNVEDHRTLFGLFLAANYLNITSLLDLTVHTIGGIMKGKTAEEIRQTFNIKDDCTLEGEEEIHGENQWALSDENPEAGSEPEIFNRRAKVQLYI